MRTVLRFPLAFLIAFAPIARAAAQHYDAYDYAEPGKEYRLVIPKRLTTVRGILVVCNYAGGDSRDYYTQNWYGMFLDTHGFAFLGSKGNNSHVASYQAFLRAVKQFGIDSHHPELVNAPYATTGFSAGGGFASTLLTRDPDRVIASAPVGARINFDVFKAPDAPTAAHLGVPTCLITGEKENSAKVVDPVFIPYRPHGALYSWMAVQGIGHEMRGQEVLAMPVLDAAVRARYPRDGDVRKGPIKLNAIDPASGWVADHTTWKGGLTRIVPAKRFNGDFGHSSWLQNEDLAFIYRAYSTYDRPLVITSPRSGMPGGAEQCDAGSDVPILVDAGQFPEWNKLAFYDGATKLGEITQGVPKFTAKNLTPGYHVFSVLGTDARGNLRTSNPVLVVVWEPRTTVHDQSP
ncbi:MAG TPA: hypothetical protein VH475_01840 [Tepidisphaeraceae bacterium]